MAGTVSCVLVRSRTAALVAALLGCLAVMLAWSTSASAVTGGSDLKADAPALSPGGGTTSGNTAGATNDLLGPQGSIWWKWTPTVTSQMSFDTCSSSTANFLAVYDGDSPVGSSGSFPGPTTANGTTGCSNVSIVNFMAIAGHAYYVAIGSATLTTPVGSPFQCPGGYLLIPGTATCHVPVNSTLRLFYKGPPENDLRQNAVTLPSAGAVSQAGQDGDATISSGELQPTTLGKSVWYRWTAPSSGTVTIDTCGPNTYIDSVIALYVQNSNTVLASNDQGCGNASSMQALVEAGQTYDIQVGSWSGVPAPGGLFELHLNLAVAEPPTPTAAAATSTSGITPNAATVGATVNTLGSPGRYRVEYGTAPGSYSATSAPQTLSAVNGDRAVSIPVTELKPETEYFYRVVVTTCGFCAAQTAATDEGSFTTGPKSSAQTKDPTAITRTVAT